LAHWRRATSEDKRALVLVLVLVRVLVRALKAAKEKKAQ
jgi:hypothetical protein